MLSFLDGSMTCNTILTHREQLPWAGHTTSKATTRWYRSSSVVC